MAEDKDWSSLLADADKKLDADEGASLSDGEKLLALFAGDDSDNPLQVPSISDNHTTALLTSPDGVAYLAEDVSVSADKAPTDSDPDGDETGGWHNYTPDHFDHHTQIEDNLSLGHTGSQPEFSRWEDAVSQFEGKTIYISEPVTLTDSAPTTGKDNFDEAASLMSGGTKRDVIVPVLPNPAPIAAKNPTVVPPSVLKESISSNAPAISAEVAPEPKAPASSLPDSSNRPLSGIFTHSTSRDIPLPEQESAATDSAPLSQTEISTVLLSDEKPDDSSSTLSVSSGSDSDKSQTTGEEDTAPSPDENDTPISTRKQAAKETEDDDYFAFRDLSHLTNVITISCLVPVVVAWSLLAYSLYMGRENALERSYVETKAQAEVFREHAERNLGIADEYTAHIKRNYEAGHSHSYKFLQADTNQRLLPYSIYITDANDRLIAGQYPGGSETFARLYADHFIVNRAVNSDNLYISRSIWDEWTKNWSFSASRRLNAPDGTYAGSIIFTINPQQFFDYHQQGSSNQEQRVFLLGRDLVIRATRTGSRDFIDSLLRKPEVVQILKSGTSGSFTAPADIDEEPYIYSYAALTNYPLIVVAGRTKASALVETNRSAINYGILALICMVSGFILWRLLLKLISRQYETEKNLRLVQAELRQSVEFRTAELVAANATLTETNNSLATLNRDLGDEIDRRRLAEEARRVAGEKLEYTAYHDTVTGLPNRTFILNYLEKDISEGGTGIMALVFVDNLNDINDAFGYEIGNELINTVAKELTNEQTGLAGAVVAHLGYGRFCIAAPGPSTAEQVARMAATINNALSHITEIHSMLIHVTATMGFVLYPEHGTSPSELMQNADNAVVAARNESPSGWSLYEERMKEVILDRMTLTAQLRQAINNGEFLLVYQPKISVTTGKVASFEALIRWHSPVLGMVRPDRFIPLAEQNGLIAPIGEWVMQEGCRFAKRLREAGWTDVTVALNVSGDQFSADNFLDIVRNAVVSAGIPNEAVEVEITETAVISSLTEAIEKISRLRENGIRIALDDFGVRYSTLSYLLRLPFDVLKVDKSFVDNIGVTDHGTDIVRMIIELAHLLGKEVVAEGVETREQYDILASLSCDIIQGYYFSKPLNETSAFDYLRQEKRWAE